MVNSSTYFFALVLFVFLAGCSGNDKKLPVTKSAKMYADFKVRSEEESRYVNCLFQFKQGGVEGAPVKLVAPAFINLNGQQLVADSGRYVGFFYEAALIAGTATTEHQISYNDGRVSYEESFSLQPFTIAPKMPERMSRKFFSIQLRPALSDGDSIRVLLTDTAFLNADVNELLPVKDGVVSINTGLLLNLKNGPVHLEILHEKALPLKNNLNGRLFTSYSLKREFLLVD